jgi:DNA polymerase-3 subunit chi
MPRIDFYLLPHEGPQARLLFACRLLEKAYSQQHQVYVHLEDAEKARLLDTLLWTFRDESFIPHQLDTPGQQAAAPILLGHCATTVKHQDILLNMHPEIPAFHENFARILEIIGPEASLRSLAEEHRIFYATKGYTITQHQLNK